MGLSKIWKASISVTPYSSWTILLHSVCQSFSHQHFFFPFKHWIVKRQIYIYIYIGKNTGVGSYSLLQGIFPIQGSSPGLLHCRQILYHLSHQGSLYIVVKSKESESCSVQFSRSFVSDSLRPHGLQHSRPPHSSPTPGVYSNSCPLSRWCHVQLFATPWTVACQAPLSMQFSRPEYCSG